MLASWLHLEGGMEGLPPSTALCAVRKAAAAFMRCKQLLPSGWVAHLEEYKSIAARSVPWLEQAVQQGDSWPPIAPNENDQLFQGLLANVLGNIILQSEVNRCSGCGKTAGQLKVCSGCSQAKYCR